MRARAERRNHMGMFVQAFNNSFEKKRDEILEAAAMKANGERENPPSIRDREIGCMDNIKVRNVEDTSNEKPFVGEDWGEWWKRCTGTEFPTECANIDCANDKKNPEIVGAHVRIEGAPCPDDEAWICPLCHSCNSDNNHASMSLSIGTKLLSVKMKKAHKTVAAEACDNED